MASPASLGWAAALSSLGQAVPNIALQYNKDAELEKERRRKTALNNEVQGILKGVPEYGSALESMTTEKAQEVLASVRPEERQQAEAILASKNGMNALSQRMPEPSPGWAAPAPEGGALGEMTKPRAKRFEKNAFVNRVMDAVGSVESGGKDIGAHPRAKNGYQAWGRFGVVPELHAQRVGLDPKNPTDLAKFKADEALQEQAARDFMQELAEKYDYDPASMYRGYYGLTSDPDAPQYLADGRRMPSSNEGVEKFMTALGDIERPMGAPASLPWDNSLLSDLVKDGKPEMKTMPRKVTRGDQEGYLLSKVKNPEQLAMLKDYIANFSNLAKSEREESKDQRAEFGKEQDRYGDNARKLTDLNFQTWKEGREQKHRDRTYKDQSIQALRAQRDSMQKQLADIRDFQKRKALGKEKDKDLAAAYPDYYSVKTKDPSLFSQFMDGSKAEPIKEIAFDDKRFTEAVRAIEDNIRATDEAISAKSGAEFTQRPAPPRALSKYLTPRKKE